MLLKSLKEIKKPGQGKIVYFSGLAESGAALLAAHFFAQFQPKQFLFLCASGSSFETAQQDFDFWLNVHGAKEANFFAESETSPYQKVLPSARQRFQRIRTLSRTLLTEEPWVAISSWDAILQRTMSRDAFVRQSLTLTAGQVIDPAALCLQLASLGYQRQDPVEDPGTFCQRGGIVDIFSPAYDYPIRIDFFDDLVERILFFHPETQRSIADEKTSVKAVFPPCREFSVDNEGLAAGRAAIKDWADSNSIPKSQRDRLSELLANGVVTLEMDNLAGFFPNHGGSLLDYLGEDALVFFWDPDRAFESGEALQSKWQESYEKIVAAGEVAAPPETLLADPKILQSQLEKKQVVGGGPVPSLTWPFEENLLTTLGTGAFSRKPAADAKHDLQTLAKEFADKLELGWRVVFVAQSQAQADRVGFMLGQKHVPFYQLSQVSGSLAEYLTSDLPRAALVLGNLTRGFVWEDERILVVTEVEFFAKKPTRKSKQAASEKVSPAQGALASLDNLVTGDLLVHVEHGIGRYKGLINLKTAEGSADYVHIEYAGSDKLYVPVYRLELIHKYVSAGEGTPALDKLGSQGFQKRKEKVKTAARDIAAKLIELYAARSSRKGYAYSPPDNLYHELSAAFPYKETPDQQKAIQDTIDDMTSPRPMDRLVCGDVGFGKTEVAVRAAFKACEDHKQVAVLVPTTILAEQHFHTFQERLKNYPIKVASLSRFRSSKEQKEILEQLAQGKVDIVVGTHRLLSKDVAFRDLGLIIVDEEQRFGVEHKEKLKMLKYTTDVLTLTATPIPRTLHMALMGLRDISIIQTAPEDRHPIKTYLAQFDRDVIKEAIQNELARGGQVFFIHNRVQSIDSIREILLEIIPTLRIVVAHGQMPETQLEQAMRGFYEKEYDLLLCTTIIENGLDVSNANTIIVNRADTFGLSQLYQIRGRVGRSQARAYAYLLVPEDAPITDEARERLSVLQRFVELGSGYSIASYDLEMRGGGDLLGEAQSGQIASVGYDLFMELLEEEIQRTKGEEPSHPNTVEINTTFVALLPEAYIVDMRTRLGVYKRAASLEDEEKLAEYEAELNERFGPLPEEAQELFWLLRIKLVAARLGFQAVAISKANIVFTAGPSPALAHDRLLALVQKPKSFVSLTPEGKIFLRCVSSNLAAAHAHVRQFIQEVATI